MRFSPKPPEKDGTRRRRCVRVDDGHRTTVGTSGLVSLAEQVSAQQREEQACVAFHTNMRGFRAHFPPRNGFAQSSTGKASIMFGGRGDVDGTVKTTPVLIPPDDVMLGNPPPTIKALDVSTSHVKSLMICSSARVSRWKSRCCWRNMNSCAPMDPSVMPGNANREFRVWRPSK